MPETIPEDVMKAADAAEARYSGSNVEVIARAIMAERERCAAYLERAAGERDEAERFDPWYSACMSGAAAIRKGEA